MGFSPLIIKPGVNTQATKMQGEAQYVESNQIRFKDGFLQKNGGFSKITDESLVGIARGAHGWSDFNRNLYLAFGTTERLMVFSDSALYDITPVSSTSDVTAAITTVAASSIVSIEDVDNRASVGDWVRITNPTYINGITLFGYYKITVNGDSFSIDSGTTATGSGTGGTTVLYTTTNTSNDVLVTYTNHGFSVDDVYETYFSTSVGGITISGQYIVDSVDDDDNFHVIASSSATSDDSAYENGGDMRIQYLLPSGLTESDSSAGYSGGSYGVGAYSYGAASVWSPARQWSFGSWGQNLVASPTNGTIYYFDVSSGLTNNSATSVTNAPEIISGCIFVASAQQQIIACGASTGSSLDSMLIRWSDVADHETWTATATNQAGSFRLSRGSAIIGGMPASQQHLIWTDTGLWSMSYIGLPYVYSFTEIADGCGLISTRAAGQLGDSVFWMSNNGFFEYSGGGANPVICSVFDEVFGDLLTDQKEKIFCAVNSMFDEITWFFPSNSGDGEVDKYVTFYRTQGIWSYGSLCRTCWIDASMFGAPIGVELDTSSGTAYSYIQHHETGNDADGSAMNSFVKTGWFSIANGDVYIFLERALVDLKSLSGDPVVYLTAYATRYANDEISDSDIVEYGPFAITPSTEYVRIRARGRFMRLKIESNDLGSSWRLGSAKYYIQEDGEDG